MDGQTSNIQNYTTVIPRLSNTRLDPCRETVSHKLQVLESIEETQHESQGSHSHGKAWKMSHKNKVLEIKNIVKVTEKSWNFSKLSGDCTFFVYVVNTRILLSWQLKSN